MFKPKTHTRLTIAGHLETSETQAASFLKLVDRPIHDFENLQRDGMAGKPGAMDTPSACGKMDTDPRASQRQLRCPRLDEENQSAGPRVTKAHAEWKEFTAGHICARTGSLMALTGWGVTCAECDRNEECPAINAVLDAWGRVVQALPGRVGPAFGKKRTIDVFSGEAWFRQMSCAWAGTQPIVVDFPRQVTLLVPALKVKVHGAPG